MNNRLFLHDQGESISYDELITKINSMDYYYPKFQGTSLSDFWINLIVGLICNKPIILLDSDISFPESDNGDINIRSSISKPIIKDFEHLISLLEVSESEITIFTSGTTGQPKEVCHSYRSLSRAVKNGEKFRNNVWGFAYNPTHMAGLQVFFQAFSNRNALINIFNKSRQYIFDNIKDFKITHISATPTFYRLLLPFEKSYECVERITLGGEKSDENLYKAIRQIFPNAKITNVYASTEAGTLFASKGDNFKIPEVIRDKFKVIDDELYIHESLLGKSASFKLIGEYYASGDLIEWTDKEEGLFRFKSRKNELINVGGYKVNPTEVEESLRSIVGVIDAHVFGKTNSILGNILCADIVREDHSSLTEVEIRTELKDKLQDFKIPRRIKFVESLSVTRTGKMSRK